MVDVTTDALKNVKDALTTFKTDIEGMAGHASNRSAVISSDCKASIDKNNEAIEQTEAIISDLSAKISDLEIAIKNTHEEIDNINERIPQIQNNISSLESQIASIDSEISYLYSQKSGSDDDSQDYIEDQIYSLKRMMDNCRDEVNDQKTELRNLNDSRINLEENLKQFKSQKSNYETELNVQKNRCSKLKDKAERMKFAFNRVESELSSYVAASKKFENVSAGMAHTGTNAVNQCLKYIEEYLSTSF